MTRLWQALVVATLAAVPTSAWAQLASGYSELRLHAYDGVEGKPVLFVERLRPDLSAKLAERVRLGVTVEAALTQGRSTQTVVQRTFETSELGPLLDLAGCTWPSEQNSFLGISEASDYLSVERLFLDVYLPGADLRLGRQAVQWGSAMVVNPTDPFPEVLVVDPWRERRGVNAVRTTIPFGESNEVQAVVATSDAMDELQLAGRAMVNVDLADLALVGAYHEASQSGIVGVDVRGTAVVGYWLEASLHLGETRHEEVAVGLDYSFPVLETLVVRAQYYRNGAGHGRVQSTDLASGLTGAVTPPTCLGGTTLLPTASATADPFAPFFRGRDYAMLLVQQSFSAAWSASAVWIQNLGDGSAIAVPTVSYLPNGWLELAVAAQLPFSLWGEGGELHPAEKDLVASFPTPLGPRSVDFSGLVPRATLIAWSRFHF